MAIAPNVNKASKYTNATAFIVLHAQCVYHDNKYGHCTSSEQRERALGNLASKASANNHSAQRICLGGISLFEKLPGGERILYPAYDPVEFFF